MIDEKKCTDINRKYIFAALRALTQTHKKIIPEATLLSDQPI